MEVEHDIEEKLTKFIDCRKYYACFLEYIMCLKLLYDSICSHKFL